ncbi:hypothetical protein JVT61DRAFT_4708 [Boletus reticuloceps]|uniref:D-arabinono-1,4-lactone oxidase n=1 Tax=Boletus reticuloceps TaxID=495285 RepID=A0A8I2YLQ2_9AGAM|nr:hypothetical protein JVT61DRAFT_4708 [Boletus reticuloceps]
MISFAPLPVGIVQQQPTPQAAAQIYEKRALLSPAIPSPPPPNFHTNQPPLHGGPGAVVGSPSYWGLNRPGSASVPGSPSPPPGSLHHGMTLLSRPSMNASMPVMPPNAPFEGRARGTAHAAVPAQSYAPTPPERVDRAFAHAIHGAHAHLDRWTSVSCTLGRKPTVYFNRFWDDVFGCGTWNVKRDRTAYASARIASGTIQQILNWPGSFETFRKVPTCLLYDEHGHVLAWGLEAKNASLMPGTFRCEWFKLFLEPRAVARRERHRPAITATSSKSFRPGKTAINLVVDFLTCLWEYAKEDITREIGAVSDLNAADVVVTCPAAWDAKGCDLMRAAAIEAGLVQSARAGDIHWRDRLRIITEPEAAAVHCARLTDLHKLRPSQNFMICDAGGGTVDLACYKITGQVQQNGNLEIAEMCARSGANCGALFLDLRFRELVKTLLVDHPAHLDAASLAYFMHSFSQTDKLAFRGEIDDDTYFHFTCFNVQDPHDPSVGLINGELAIPGILIRREVFDPVVNQVLDMIEEQSRKIEQRIDALLLVGGFAGSEYLFSKVEAKFSGKIKVIARPSDADTATLRGAAQYGLSRKTIVSTVIVPRAYIMKVKLPAEPEDWLKRPAYINENSANVAICENRLQYLVMKGSILRKGGVDDGTEICLQDCHFVAVLYTSETDKMMRYTDEGETTELCKWTVDLSSLPTFQHNASISHPNGFYTEFELGLEMDSAEVRGVLFYEGQDEWDRRVDLNLVWWCGALVVGHVRIRSIGHVRVWSFTKHRLALVFKAVQSNGIPSHPHMSSPFFSNWGRTFACEPIAIFEPDSVQQCQRILALARTHRKVVRAVGVGHSPSDLPCTTGYMVRTTKLNRLLEVNVEKRYVVVEAGITIDALHAALAKHGLAMINVGSISDQTLGGIITTATHGTGIQYGVISTHVLALSILLADGTRVSCSRAERADLFIASICGLGSTGLIMTVMLQVEPAFRLRETHQMMGFQQCVQDMDGLVRAGEHVRIWWYPAA